jgi:hypothetical protein
LLSHIIIPLYVSLRTEILEILIRLVLDLDNCNLISDRDSDLSYVFVVVLTKSAVNKAQTISQSKNIENVVFSEVS